MKLLNQLRAQKQADREAVLYRNLIRREAKIGGQLLGPIPAGSRREFFCLDEHTWIWHEEWTDPQTGQRKVVTTRYDMRPNGVLKAQDGQAYQYITLPEARNLSQAINLYMKQVGAEIYGAAT